MKKIQKILVANRGEIACRIIKTAKKMGLKTVAVYSTEDSNSLHVGMADEAYCIGSAHPRDSYLNTENILQALEFSLYSGAQALHPGYGFLSENSKFAQLVENCGVSFVGPNRKAMEMMGDKIQSKLAAKAANVEAIPGYDGVVTSIDHALSIANDIGYPIMLKASAGGGGKGLRIIANDAELTAAWKVTQGEAESSFGDSRLLIEKCILSPRHIEVQILGDKYGNYVHLPERECSIQRRNQKIIEETPCYKLDDKTRKHLGEQAVALARHVGYDSAGTCEFLLDPITNSFYFLEMNTRLQVEHPITEMITGLDMVELMINVASGLELNLQQKDIKANGYAIESRIYAEHPNSFLPSVGTIDHVSFPTDAVSFVNSGHVRCDAAIQSGTNISMYYDSLIAKLCTFDTSRSGAISKMKKSLDSLVLQGITHNIPLLRDIYENKQFKEGSMNTDFIKNEYPDGFQGPLLTTRTRNYLLAVSSILHHMIQKWRLDDISSNASEALDSNDNLHYISLDGGIFTSVSTSKGENDNEFDVSIDGKSIPVILDWKYGKSPLIHVSIKKESFLFQFSNPTALGFTLQFQGSNFEISIKSYRQMELTKHMLNRTLSTSSSENIHSPMPGTILSCSLQAGQLVQKGEELCVVEAMKMQNILRAPISGVVESIHIKKGDIVCANQLLISINWNPLLN